MANRVKSAKSNKTSLRQRTHDSVDLLMDNAESVKDRGTEGLINLQEKASAMKENVDGYIKENPEKSVLIAAGIGAVAGAILAAAMMRRRA